MAKQDLNLKTLLQNKIIEPEENGKAGQEKRVEDLFEIEGLLNTGGDEEAQEAPAAEPENISSVLPEEESDEDELQDNEEAINEAAGWVNETVFSPQPREEAIPFEIPEVPERPVTERPAGADRPSGLDRPMVLERQETQLFKASPSYDGGAETFGKAGGVGTQELAIFTKDSFELNYFEDGKAKLKVEQPKARFEMTEARKFKLETDGAGRHYGFSCAAGEVTVNTTGRQADVKVKNANGEIMSQAQLPLKIVRGAFTITLADNALKIFWK